MPAMTAERIPDRPRPPARASLPFRVTKQFDGIHMEWTETHVVGHGSQKKSVTMPMRILGNDLVAWGRIAPHVLKLMEMFRDLETENERLLAENERLSVEIIGLEGEKAKRDIGERLPNGPGRPKKN